MKHFQATGNTAEPTGRADSVSVSLITSPSHHNLNYFCHEQRQKSLGKFVSVPEGLKWLG